MTLLTQRKAVLLQAQRGPEGPRGFQEVKVTRLSDNVKVKQSCYRPRGFQEVKVPRFCDKSAGWW